MPVTILVGTQWGDEGKGKIADLLGDEASVIARYNGGDNAGHTLNVDDITYKLHFIPSGVLREGVISIMGGGMVIHPLRLLGEMDTLAEKGVDISPERLKLASNAHVITPGHQALEKASEIARGKSKIGTTGRGIGPTYASKAARTGIWASEMRNPAGFADKLTAFLEDVNKTLTGIYDLEPLNIQEHVAEFTAAARRLAPYLVDVSPYLNSVLKAGKTVLAEGGQATLLDIDHGNYPYVTSSNASAGGALTGLGIGPKYVNRVMGVAKAFCTRVGSGPFPTEQDNDIGGILRGDGSKPWDDFGTTTGRPRRCGWLDMVALRYAVDLNGLTELALMKLDILSRFEEIQVAVAYEVDGQRIDDFPVDQAMFQNATPIYETLPGWNSDIMNVTAYQDLPDQARQYVEWIEKHLGVPISIVSVGPGRQQSLLR